VHIAGEHLGIELTDWNEVTIARHAVEVLGRLPGADEPIESQPRTTAIDETCPRPCGLPARGTMRPLPLVAAGLVLLVALVVRRRLGRLSTLAVLAVVTVLGVYGSGTVRLPEPEEAVARVGATVGAWTYALVGALAFLEAGAFVGLVAPGEFAVVFGGLIAGRGDIELLPLIAAVWIAALAGDLASYGFGRAVGRAWALRHGSRFGITPARLEWAERYFAAHGGATILLGRFVGIVRALAPFIAGTSRMPFRRFALVDALGAGLWTSAFSLLGFACWQSLDRALQLARRGKLGLAIVLIIATGAFAAYRLARDPRSRHRLRTWLRKTAAAVRLRLGERGPAIDERYWLAAKGHAPASAERTEPQSPENNADDAPERLVNSGRRTTAPPRGHTTPPT
jgi:membrane protein DedA with SNARE-associated domain